MMRLFATAGLALALTVPLAAHADEMADKVAVAKALVDKTTLKTLDMGFSGALEKTVAQMPEDKAEKVRKEARAEFDTQRQNLLDGISKEYAEKFSLADLKHLQGIYEDPIYQKYQAINADPKSEINVISQAAVTRLLNMLTLAAAGDQKPNVPNYEKQMQMPSK
ncbi:hypothetical protein HCU64_18375 [Methylobacterium sp. C25]|uniref:hypothetical protein n=1 Tax=Methylobacterium sp. C25 TaxID=2721622 RepID=UPI001F278BED|nr:hypothetical protein [Methylobacterium sp. C25]MCE4225722.1 hypothetical protein [Methylobacterium sp. C25]